MNDSYIESLYIKIEPRHDGDYTIYRRNPATGQASDTGLTFRDIERAQRVLAYIAQELAEEVVGG